jgi:hypothetical protein
VPVVFTTIIGVDVCLHSYKKLFWRLLAFEAALFASAFIGLNCGEDIW